MGFQGPPPVFFRLTTGLSEAGGYPVDNPLPGGYTRRSLRGPRSRRMPCRKISRQSQRLPGRGAFWFRFIWLWGNLNDQVAQGEGAAGMVAAVNQVGFRTWGCRPRRCGSGQGRQCRRILLQAYHRPEQESGTESKIGIFGDFPPAFWMIFPCRSLRPLHETVQQSPVFSLG